MNLLEGEKDESLIDESSVEEKYSMWGFWVNTINHALILITAAYITWYSFKFGFQEATTWHAWYSTIGYQVLMTEGILAMYNITRIQSG